MSIPSFAAAQIIRALPRVSLSRAVGKLCDQKLPPGFSAVVQKAYCAAYDVKMNEAQEPGPYPSFDAFFTRPLKDGMRPIADVPLVSPADGKLSAAGDVEAGDTILVKKQRYDIAELIGDASDALRYRGGQFGVVYLAPSDYHRVHSPVSGQITAIRGIPGDLFPVNSIGEEYVDGLFVRNNRVCICIDTEELGRVSVVMVGATIVGRISVSVIPEPAVPAGATKLEPGRPVQRGDEIGMFHLGSTAVVLLEPGVTIERELGKVQMGEALWEGR
ncbi:MAG: archaetidylserine decarboxylase [Polyangiaceae bacterium]|nr:archaetidylserine decarboxylase [Polyangiaceae bacterium]